MRQILTALLITAGTSLALSQTNPEPVLEAIRAGNTEQVRELVPNLPPTAQQADYLTAAVGSGESMVALLIELGFDVNAQTSDALGATAMMYAAYNNDIATMERLHDAGADLDLPDTIGDPAINWAAYGGRLEAVSWLLEHDVRVDQVGHGNATQIAKRRGFPAIIDALCAYRTCNDSGNHRIAGLAMAIDSGDSATFERLHVSGAAAWLDHTGRPLLHRASRQGQKDMVATMLAGGANVDLRDDIGFTPLMEAAREGHQTIVDQLLSGGANANAIAFDSALRLTPMHLAAIGGDPAIVKILARTGANLDAQDTDGSTPLLWALFEQNSEAVGTLLQLGADPLIKNKFDYSAAQFLDQGS